MNFKPTIERYLKPEILSKLINVKRKIQNLYFMNKEPKKLDNKILVATHHKTGTVWFMNIFKDIAAFSSLNFYSGEWENFYEEVDIYFNHHSNFPFNKFTFDYKGIHIIRDPRDIIISSTFYHQKAKEPWLHIPQENFGGMTYQEKINSFDSFEEKAIFEINNSAGNNIMDIKNWDYSNENFLEIKYEEIIKDYNLQKFHDIFEFLNFSGDLIPDLLKIAWKNSLFSGQVKSSKHIRSGNTKQFQKYFTPVLKRKFLDKFDDLLIEIGYENSNNW